MPSRTTSGAAAPACAPRCARPRCRHSREDTRIAVLAHGVERQLGHLLRVVDREDEVRRVTGRAAGVRERALVEQDEVGPAELGQMAGQAVADDAGADHDRLAVSGNVRLQVRNGSRVSGTDISRREQRTSRIFVRSRSLDVLAHDPLGRRSPSPARIASSSPGARARPAPSSCGRARATRSAAAAVVRPRASPTRNWLWLAAIDGPVDALVELDQGAVVGRRRRHPSTAIKRRQLVRSASFARSAASRAASGSSTTADVAESTRGRALDGGDEVPRRGNTSTSRSCASRRSGFANRRPAEPELAPSARAR